VNDRNGRKADFSDIVPSGSLSARTSSASCAENHRLMHALALAAQSGLLGATECINSCIYLRPVNHALLSFCNHRANPCWSATCAFPRPNRTSRYSVTPWKVLAASASTKTPVAARSHNGPASREPSTTCAVAMRWLCGSWIASVDRLVMLSN
jgi:hypothetical protein